MIPANPPRAVRLLLAALTASACTAWADGSAGPVTPAATPAPAVNGFAPDLHATRRKPVAHGTTQPYEPVRAIDDEGQIAEIDMFVGESRIFPTPGVARIAVGNGASLTADALDGKEVILFANAVGTSSLFIWNADGRYQRLKINVVPGDTTRFAREIAVFLSTIPKARASVVGANIIVEGEGLSEPDLAKIDELAKRYPQIVNFTNRVGWEQMVSMDVKVVEFPISALRQVGMNWTGVGGGAVGGIWSPISAGHSGNYALPVQQSGTNVPPVTIANGASAIAPGALTLLSNLNLGLNAQLELLEQQGRAAMLAEPQLSTRSGSKASFVAGGEIPYAVSSIAGSNVVFKTYGVKLDITPRVGANGVIRAVVHTEVSGIDPSVTTPAGPALLERTIDTEFNIHGGETIVLAGLLQRETHNDINKLPFLGDIPILGALFRSKNFQDKQTELVVFITPNVRDATSPGNVDRIRATGERLQEDMGASPYLEQPLQPGADYAHPDALSGAVSVTPAAVAPAAVTVPAPDLRFARSREGSVLTVSTDATPLRAAPSDSAQLLRLLSRGATVVLGDAEPEGATTGHWQSVRLGDITGWVHAESVTPLRLEAANAILSRVPQGARSAPGQSAQGNSHPVTADEATPASPHTVFRVQIDDLALHATPDVNSSVVARVARGTLLTGLAQARVDGWTSVRFGSGTAVARGWADSQWLLPVEAQ